MNRITALGFMLITSALACHSAFSETKTLNYKNQRGSLLELTLLPENKVAGFFTTAVASKSCPEAINQKRPISGYLIGNAITFSTFYPMCNSVVSITGNFAHDQKTIDTIWIVNKQSDNAARQDIGARFIGHDSYIKVS